MILQVKHALEQNILFLSCHLDKLRRMGCEALLVQPGQSTHFCQDLSNFWQIRQLLQLVLATVSPWEQVTAQPEQQVTTETRGSSMGKLFCRTKGKATRLTAY